MMSDKATGQNNQIVPGGGEMGALIRSKDWSVTSLGNIETWPQSLRTTLSILLNSKFPMFLFWGPELICFYNDAFRPSLGKDGKHPAILGGRGEDYWKETWPIIKPLIDQVLSGGEATWDEDQLIPIYRNGKMEDVFWTFSYSPVNDESGKPAGVYVTCSETTDKVIMRKKLEESKDQLQFAIEATELATFDYNPATDKFSGNQRLKEWFGLPKRTEIELHHAINAITEKDQQTVVEAIQKALGYSSGGQYDIEYTIIHPIAKKERIVRARGRAWFNEDKIAYRFNGSLQDVTEQVIARKKVEAGEQRFQAAVAAVEGIVWTNNAEGKMEGEQPGWAALTGQSYHQYQGYGWADAVHPDDARPTIDAWNEAVKERRPFNFEHRIRLKNGNWGVFSVRAIPVLNDEGTVSEWVGVHTDITDQKNARKKIVESEQRFRTMADNIPNLAWMANADGWIFWYNKKWYEYTGTDIEQMKGWGWQSVHHPHQLEAVLKKWQSSIKSGQPFEMIFPIKSAGGEFRQFLTRVLPVPDGEGKIYQWFGTNTDITERMEAEEALKESEERFRTMAEGTDILIATSDETGNATYFNKAWTDIIGRPMEDLVKFGWVHQIHPEDRDWFVNIYLAACERRESFGGEFRIADKKGSYRWLLAKGSPRFMPEGSFAGYISSCIDITGRKKAEEALIESEQRFRNIANSAPVLIWMSGIDKLRNFFNTAWLVFTGRGMDQEYGNGWNEGVHADDLQKSLGIYTNAFDLHQEFYMEYRLKRYDGEYRWISDKGVPHFTPDGIFEGYIGACMDIHEQIIYQKKLKEDEERLNIIIEASELGTWDLNLITNEINYSDRYLEILGYKTNMTIPHSVILKQIHPDDLVIRESAFKRAFVNGSLQYEIRIIWTDHSIHWVEVNGKVFFDQDKMPVKIIGTLRDTTDEKNYRQQLQEREQKFRLLADSMPQHIWTADTGGNLNYYNQSVFSYTGLTIEQIRKDGWIQIVHPDEREENIRLWMNSVSSGKDFLFEHRFLRHDGEYRWQLSRAIPQKDNEGNIKMWVGTSTDIQDQKTLAYELDKKVKERTSQLEQKNKELEIMNAELQSFAYVSSHDLQEPLRKIQTFASRILEKEQQQLSENGKDYFRRIQEAAKRMQTLIEDLLAYSRTNTTERNFQNTNINTILEQVKAELKEDIQQKHAFIEATPLCSARIIPFQFRQLIHNLISNALKFSKPGKPPHIVFNSEMVEGSKLAIGGVSPQVIYCHLSVSDNGIGFDPQYKDRIFEVFQRLHGKDEYKGTGIGLAIVKKIVENHKGIITAKSELGEGATFDIYFPNT
ncbi:MAG: PAS domain S-box protein [Ferruginibacter sp.]|nr:PAS domain S-box protein [Ferruginibacter sp.]